MPFEAEETKLWEAALWDGLRSDPDSTRMDEVFFRRHDALLWLTHDLGWNTAVCPSEETYRLLRQERYDEALDRYVEDMRAEGRDQAGWHVRKVRALRYVKD